MFGAFKIVEENQWNSIKHMDRYNNNIYTIIKTINILSFALTILSRHFQKSTIFIRAQLLCVAVFILVVCPICMPFCSINILFSGLFFVAPCSSMEYIVTSYCSASYPRKFRFKYRFDLLIIEFTYSRNVIQHSNRQSSMRVKNN